jgi:2-keto-4-pentenoate hydratase/2-oxohepta-3-ene-1,7-dioic acid hydratase in catechol pathway
MFCIEQNGKGSRWRFPVDNSLIALRQLGYAYGVRFVRLRGPDGVAVHARVDGASAHLLDAPPWASPGAGSTARAWTDEDLLCPVVPTKIVCIGRNYAAHARELGSDSPAEPLIFLKPPSSLIGPGDAVVLPPESTRVEHEAELGVVMGRRARLVSKERAMEYVFGFVCVCDVTARDLQRADGQWTRAKGFDTFCPVGPFIETDFDPKNARIVCRVNGEVRQDASTAQMIFDVPTLVAYVSRVMTLEPGDLLVTGTPEGVGPLAAGDALEVEIGPEGMGGALGVLRLRVAREDGRDPSL